jgi:hypothetical protein
MECAEKCQPPDTRIERLLRSWGGAIIVYREKVLWCFTRVKFYWTLSWAIHMQWCLLGIFQHNSSLILETCSRKWLKFLNTWWGVLAKELCDRVYNFMQDREVLPRFQAVVFSHETLLVLKRNFSWTAFVCSRWIEYVLIVTDFKATLYIYRT